MCDHGSVSVVPPPGPEWPRQEGIVTFERRAFPVGCSFFFFQAEDGIRDKLVTGVQTCALPISEIASRVLREFAATMRFRRAEIWLLDRQKRLRRLSGYGRVPAASDTQGVPLQGCPFGRSVVRRRQAVLRAAASPGAPRRRMCHVGWRGLTSLFGAPLRGPDGPIGLLFADRGGRPFDMSATDLEVATALAGLITEVVKGALAREGETRRRNGLLLLNQVGRAISTEESLPILLPRLARNVREGSKVLGVVGAL